MSATMVPGTMQASLRECRLVLERLVQVAGVEPGLVPSTRDAALFALAGGFCHFDGLESQFEAVEPAAAAAVRLAEGPDGLTLDAGGCHAWLVAEAAADLAVDRHRRTGRGELTVTNLSCADQLGAVGGFAEAHGYSARLEAAPGAVRLTLEPCTTRPGATLTRIRLDGLTVDRALWMHLFHRANQALAPDSFASRRHAGALVVEADGRVIGRSDEDDTDLSLLSAKLAGTLAEPSHS
jgi:hypothetical protein